MRCVKKEVGRGVAKCCRRGVSPAALFIVFLAAEYLAGLRGALSVTFAVGLLLLLISSGLHVCLCSSCASNNLESTSGLEHSTSVLEM